MIPGLNCQDGVVLSDVQVYGSNSIRVLRSLINQGRPKVVCEQIMSQPVTIWVGMWNLVYSKKRTQAIDGTSPDKYLKRVSWQNMPDILLRICLATLRPIMSHRSPIPPYTREISPSYSSVHHHGSPYQYSVSFRYLCRLPRPTVICLVGRYWQSTWNNTPTKSGPLRERKLPSCRSDTFLLEMGARCRWHAKWHRAWHRAGTVPSYVEVGPGTPAITWPVYTYLGLVIWTSEWAEHGTERHNTYAGKKNGVPTKFFRTSAFIYS